MTVTSRMCKKYTIFCNKSNVLPKQEKEVKMVSQKKSQCRLGGSRSGHINININKDMCFISQYIVTAVTCCS